MDSIDIMEHKESISTNLAEPNENISTWNAHEHFAACSQLKQILDIGITGSYAAMSTVIEALLNIRPKGRPLSALNKSNAIGVAGRKRLAVKNLTQKEVLDFEHAARNAGETLKPTEKQCDPRSCRKYNGQDHDRRDCPSRILGTDDENERSPAQRSLCQAMYLRANFIFHQ